MGLKKNTKKSDFCVKTQENTSQEGNTNSSWRARKWIFTLNNYTKKECVELKEILTQKTQHFIFGEEIGEQGTPHLQGYFEMKNPIKFESIKKWNNRLHLEIARGTLEDNFNYCSKDGKIHTNIYIEKPDIIKEDELKEWHKTIFNIIQNEKPNKRTVYWIYDDKGCSGKTDLCKFLDYNKHAFLLGGGKASDMKNLLIKEGEKHSRDILIDCPRTMEGFVSYQFIENCKDGFICSLKYEGGRKYISTPHIFVFANFKPDTTKLSLDRWNIQELINDKLIDITQECIDDDNMLILPKRKRKS